MCKKCFTTWDDVPKEELVNAVNIIFDPPVDQMASMEDDREELISALKEKDVTLKELETLT